MPRVAYVNGSYRPYASAVIHIDDRGYQFADAVYEVIAVSQGRLIDLQLHLRRLDRSLGELRISRPMSDAALAQVLHRVVQLNRVRDGILYLQISRGVALRDHAFPAAAVPQFVVTVHRKKPVDPRLFEEGVAVITIDDIRWKRRDIKSTSLLANVLGKQRAREAGAYEAWQVDDGAITEGTVSNAWIVTHDGVLVTRPAGPEILNGVTRQVVVQLAAEAGLTFKERAFSPKEAGQAQEAFITGTTAHVLPVTQLNGIAVGNGLRGPFTRRLQQSYAAHIAAETASE